jgi:hypothetical protein
MSKIVKFSESPLGTPQKLSAEEPSLKERKWRRRSCPVRGRVVKEYLFHVDEIERDVRKNQPRIQDCSTSKVSELADQMNEYGQLTGGCVLWSPLVEKYLLLWGNTRYRAVCQLQARTDSILEAPAGFIWMSRYEEEKKDIPLYQAKENNVHPVSQRATMGDNVESMMKMIGEGLLDTSQYTFEEMATPEQRKAVNKMAKQCHMPGGGKLKTLWNRLRVKEPSIVRRMRTYDKHSLAKLTALHVGPEYGWGPHACDGISQSGEVLIAEDGTRVALYLMTQESTLHAPTLSNTHKKRNIQKLADEIVLVAALNTKVASNIEAARKKVIEDIKKWNASLKAGKCIDRVLFVPQTASEQAKELDGFVMDVRF